MEGIIVSLAIKYLVSEIASQGATTDWAQVKADFGVKVKSLVHAAWLEAAVERAGDAVIDATAKLCQDRADVAVLLTDLAAKDIGAAEGALKAMLLKVVSGDVATILAAA